MKSESKALEYVQSSLRSASEIVKSGGHVTMKYRDQIFRMHYDNRRVLMGESTIPSKIEQLLDSKPLENVVHGENLRFISRMYKNKIYGKFTNVNNGANKYKCKEEIAVRNFIKGLLANPPMFNLNPKEFNSYREIIDYVKAYNPLLRFSEVGLSQYKHKFVKIMKVHKTKESDAFVRYVKDKFKDFDENAFYGYSVKSQSKSTNLITPNNP